ncbi:ANTAR domain-containing protein [Rhodococcus qingshengii]|uniref:ANTAR domain-containing protein n=1 Tax=Rhodococcus qingshengii TaxID=334542 RepID=UPI0037CBAD77
MDDSPEAHKPHTSSTTSSAQPITDDIFESLDRFSALVRNTNAPEGQIQTFCEQMVATIPTVDMAGVALIPERGTTPQTVKCTDARVLEIELDQHRVDEGPGVESARTGQRMRVNSGDVTSKWPDFARCAESVGVSSYLSVPLSIDEVQVGVLSLYSFVDHGFAEIDGVLLQVFIAAVEGAVWKSRRGEEWRVEIAGLRAAMKSRGHIEQAKGMLMVVHAITEDQAFEMLAAQSQRQNIRVTTVAAEIIRALSGQTGF